MGQTFEFLDEPLIGSEKLASLGDGRHEIAKDFGGMQVFATIADGKVTGYDVEGQGDGREARMFVREPAGGAITPDIRNLRLCACNGGCVCKQIQGD